MGYECGMRCNMVDQGAYSATPRALTHFGEERPVYFKAPVEPSLLVVVLYLVEVEVSLST